MQTCSATKLPNMTNNDQVTKDNTMQVCKLAQSIPTNLSSRVQVTKENVSMQTCTQVFQPI
jgi:hypothetical protein